MVADLHEDSSLEQSSMTAGSLYTRSLSLSLLYTHTEVQKYSPSASKGRRLESQLFLLNAWLCATV